MVAVPGSRCLHRCPPLTPPGQRHSGIPATCNRSSPNEMSDRVRQTRRRPSACAAMCRRASPLIGTWTDGRRIGASGRQLGWLVARTRHRHHRYPDHNCWRNQQNRPGRWPGRSLTDDSTHHMVELRGFEPHTRRAEMPSELRRMFDDVVTRTSVVLGICVDLLRDVTELAAPNRCVSVMSLRIGVAPDRTHLKCAGQQ
jgi:hypothetical protein